MPTLDPLPDRVLASVRRLGRLGRRSPRDFRRWIEQTSNLLHLSVLLFVPLLIVVVTTLANTVEPLSFLLFPPLAAGTYTLFANPESKYASPTRFVSGLTVGAACGWVAMELGVLIGGGSVGGSTSPTGSLGVDALTAGTAVFLTSAVTWALDVEEASAFSTALLGLLVPDGQALAFVASVAVASTIVAAVFTVWREQFYERRARLLYESTDGGDHIIVPMVGENPNETAMLGGRLAAAHDAGKIVLLDFVSDDDIERAKRNLSDDPPGDGPGATDGGRGADVVATDAQRTSADESVDRTSVGDGPAVDSPVNGPLADQIADGEADGKSATDMAERRVAAEAAARLERLASVIESELDVPCQTVAATGRSMAATTRKAAHDTDCDLIAASYKERHGGLAPKFLELFECELDVVVHRSTDGQTEWSDVLVPVRRASDLAHSMLDSGARLAGETGQLSVATCVDSDRQRRRGEEMLANLAETVDRTVETRVSTTAVETFLERNASHFDIVIMGASMNRSGASRFVSPPTFERIDGLDTDVVIVDRP